MQVTHREFRTADEIIRSATEVRNRLMNGRPAVVARKEVDERPAVGKRTIMRMPEWMTAPKSYDDHVAYWEKWFAATHFERLRMYLSRRAIILGFSLADIRSDLRSPELVEARHLLVGEVANEQAPGMSYSQLGRLFHRDHTTIIYSLQTLAKRSGVEFRARREPEKIISRNPATMARIRELLDAGLKVSDIAQDVGSSMTAVYENARRMGWISPVKYKKRKGGQE